MHIPIMIRLGWRDELIIMTSSVDVGRTKMEPRVVVGLQIVQNIGYRLGNRFRSFVNVDLATRNSKQIFPDHSFEAND